MPKKERVIHNVKEIELTAKTVDEAKKAALEQLGVTEDQVEVIVLKKGRGGVLGMGAEEAKILVRIIDNKPADSNPGHGNIAEESKEILGTLIKLLGIEAEILIAPGDGDSPLTLNINGDDLGALIGRHGQALASLQYILRMIIAEKQKSWIPINIDVGGYKQRRYDSLQRLALRLADQVKASRRPINLEPMPADERRIIHMALSENPEVTTQSTGDGEQRKVIVLLRNR
jgi:spoIIIJ-associated protein